MKVATTFRERLIGLAFRREPPADGLLLPRTRSVHTFGMRFALDLVWLGARDEVVRVDRHVSPRRHRACARARAVVRVDRAVPPRRLRTCLRARSVLEVPAP